MSLGDSKPEKMLSSAFAEIDGRHVWLLVGVLTSETSLAWVWLVVTVWMTVLAQQAEPYRHLLLCCPKSSAPQQFFGGLSEWVELRLLSLILLHFLGLVCIE